MSESLSVYMSRGEDLRDFTSTAKRVKKGFSKLEKQAVVVSIMRTPKFNTMDKFISLWELLARNDFKIWDVKEKLDELENFYLSFIAQKYKWDKNKINKIVNEMFAKLFHDIEKYVWFQNKIIPTESNGYTINTKLLDFSNPAIVIGGKPFEINIGTWNISILWFWEILSSIIQQGLINDLWVEWLEAEVVDLGNVTENIDLSGSEDEIFEKLANEIANRVKRIIDNNRVPIIHWFEWWIKSIVWEPYKDATFSLTALWLSEIFDVTLIVRKKVKWILIIRLGMESMKKANNL